MKRIQFYRYGGPGEMRLEEYQLPVLQKGEVLVRVKAASVNPVDWKIRQGAMKFITGRKFPRAMGQDFSGVVGAIGPGVKRFKVGDEVFGTTPIKTSGSFAETLITLEKLALRKPAGLSHEVVATLPVAATTAWIALVKKGNLKSGQKVFINGAYGAVGQAAIQIAKVFGASVAGRVSSHSMHEARGIGADTVLDYNQTIPENLSGEFDIVLDCHGGLKVDESNRLVKPGGVVLDINPSFTKIIHSIFSRSRKIAMGRQDTVTLQKVADLAASGHLKIAIGRTVGLDEGIDLIKDLETGHRVKGKGLIVMA